MSIVTVQIGQCGNQIGEKIFETIASDCFEYKAQTASDRTLNGSYVSESLQRFFAECESETDALVAHSVLVDMESKVVNRLVSNTFTTGSQPTQQWKFRACNSYTQKKGSGNNW